jgi:ligand-binding sensor domain-containing protein
MRFRSKREILFTIGCCFVFSFVSHGQTYRFMNYGTDSKIPNGFIYTLNQDNNGYLWVGTGAGLAKFDGFNFYNITFPDSAAGRYPAASLKDMHGILWFGCNDGSVYYTDDDNLKAINISNTRTINTILEDRDGLIYIIPQGGKIYTLNPVQPDKVTAYGVPEDIIVFSAAFTQSGDLLIGTQENIRQCRIENDSLTVLSTIEGFDYSGIRAIHKLKESDTFIIGTEGSGLYILGLSGNDFGLRRFSGHPELDYLTVQSITEDTDNYLWIATNETGILQVMLSQHEDSIESVKYFNKDSGLPGNNARLVFQDIEGNYWMGLFGDGLSLLNTYAFSFFSPGRTPETNNIIYVNQINEDYFLGTPIGYYLFDIENYRVKSFTNLIQRTGRNEIA